MGDAVACVAHVLGFSVGYVHVDAQQHVLEAFCSVVHEAQLEALLVEEALGKGPPEGVGGQSCLIGELELREELLKDDLCRLNRTDGKEEGR